GLSAPRPAGLRHAAHAGRPHRVGLDCRTTGAGGSVRLGHHPAGPSRYAASMAWSGGIAGARGSNPAGTLRPTVRPEAAAAVAAPGSGQPAPPGTAADPTAARGKRPSRGGTAERAAPR